MVFIDKKLCTGLFHFPAAAEKQRLVGSVFSMLSLVEHILKLVLS